MRKYKSWLLLLIFLPMAICASANTGKGKVEGVLHGYVTDAVTKKPLPGVVVSAQVPGTNNSNQVTTDADGYYRFAQLPGAQVNVVFDKKGYQPCKRPNIAVKEKSAIRLNIEFLPEEVGDEPDNAEYPLLRLMQTK